MQVQKGIFGLAVSPRLWWAKFSGKVLAIAAKEGTGPCVGQELVFKQSLFDPALFCCHCERGVLRAVIAVHADGTPELRKRVLESFPIRGAEVG